MPDETPVPIKLEPLAAPASGAPNTPNIQTPPAPVSSSQNTSLTPCITPQARPTSSLPTPTQYARLPTGSPLTDANFTLKWMAATSYNPEYADCVINIQGKAILVHRATVLAQSDYLKSLCSKTRDTTTGLFSIDVPGNAFPVPHSSLLSAAQGVLHTMYLQEATSVLRHSKPEHAQTIQSAFLAQAFVFAGSWKAYFSMEVILHQIATAWQNLDITNSTPAKMQLCAGIKALLEALEDNTLTAGFTTFECPSSSNTIDQLTSPSSNTPTPERIARKAAFSLCVEFILTHMANLQASGHLLPLTQRFPALSDAIINIVTRPKTGGSKAQAYKCKRCTTMGRRAQAVAHVADLDCSPCAICRALDGELGVVAKVPPLATAPRNRTQDTPQDGDVRNTEHQTPPTKDRAQKQAPQAATPTSARASQSARPAASTTGAAARQGLAKRPSASEVQKGSAKKKPRKKSGNGGRGGKDPDSDYVPDDVIDLVSD